MHGEHRVSIDQPAAVVFDYIADGTHNPTWRPSVLEVSVRTGDGREGTVWRQVVRGPAGRSADADYRVTRHDRPDAYGFEVIDGPVRGTGLYTLTDGDDGETTVTFELTLKPRGAMRVLTGFVLRQMVEELDNLDLLRDLFGRRNRGPE